MSEGKGTWRKRLLTLSAAVIICTASGRAQTPGLLVYEGTVIYGMSVDEQLGTGMLELADRDEQQPEVWCADPALTVRRGSRYVALAPQDAGGLYARNAGQIVSVLSRSWPRVSLSQLQENCAVSDLTLQEAIAATQLAVWTLTQGYMQYMGEERVDTVVTWLLLGETDVPCTDGLRVYWPLEAGLQPLVGLE